jgi:hypothetical protein
MKKNKVFLCLNNFRAEYSDSHNNTIPAPHIPEINLSMLYHLGAIQPAVFLKQKVHFAAFEIDN